MRSSLLITTASVFAGVLCSAAPAAADAPKLFVRAEQAEGRGFTGIPYFDVGVVPGGRRRAGRISVENRARRRVTVSVDAVDAVTAVNIGSAFKVRGQRRTGPTRWVVVPRRRVSIAPGRRALIPVSLDVPRSVRPGDYLSGVSIEATGQSNLTSAGANLAISNSQRYVIGLQSTVRGPRSPRLSLTSAAVVRRPAGLTFLVGARNSGNVLLKTVTGTVTVTSDGRTVKRERFGPGTFVTGTAIKLALLARTEQPRAGAEYRVRAVFRSAGGIVTLDRTVRFGTKDAKIQEAYGGPKVQDGNSRLLWVAAGLALVALLAAALVLLRRRDRGQSSRSPAGDGMVALSKALALAAGEPVSVFVIEPVAADLKLRRKITNRLVPVLRPNDVVAMLDERAMLVVAPQTGEAMAAAMAGEMDRALASPDGTFPLVGVQTSRAAFGAPELVAAARGVHRIGMATAA